MPDWSIKIVPAARPTPDEPAAFVPEDGIYGTMRPWQGVRSHV
ncbi:MAG TPA: hypothetical protein VGK96_26660 [Candidatus Sulfotelmatobacter sp.]|jgi:hypothetical protein|nr:hypothetical protein [Stellaceae bacterium]